PLRLGEVWPPRLVLHDVAARARAGDDTVDCTLWARHHLRQALRLTLASDGPAMDPDGAEVPGLQLDALAVALPPSPRRAAAEPDEPFLPLVARLRWTAAFAE